MLVFFCLCVRCARIGVGQPQWRGYLEPGNCVHGHVFLIFFLGHTHFQVLAMSWWTWSLCIFIPFSGPLSLQLQPFSWWTWSLVPLYLHFWHPNFFSSYSLFMVDMVPLFFSLIFLFFYWTTLSPVTATFMVDMVSRASLSPFLAPKFFFLVTAFSWWTWSLCFFL